MTEDEPTEEQIQRADALASRFGCFDANRSLLCFEDATRGLATMDIELR